MLLLSFLLISVVLGLTNLIDCDWITFFYHIYRTRLTKNSKKYFSNKTIWIIGSSSGIGEFLVYNLVKEDAKKIIISSRRENELNRVKENSNKISLKTEIIIERLDLDSKDQNLKEKIENMVAINNDIDIIVLNAGITSRGLGIDTNIDVYNKLYEANVLNVIFFVKTLIQKLRSLNIIGKSHKRRQIAVTSSLAGRIGAPDQCAYAMSKHAVNGFLESLRMELVSLNIDINTICPGHVAITNSSHPGIGQTLDQHSGRRNDNNSKDKHNKMTLTRCAELYTTALQFSLTESWISTQPNLLFIQLRQYLPFLLGPMGKIIGPSRVQKLVADQ